MFEYVFVRHKVEATQAARGGSSYQVAVQERAREGWRLVQILVEQPAASVREYVLIFERPSASASS